MLILHGAVPELGGAGEAARAEGTNSVTFGNPPSQTIMERAGTPSLLNDPPDVFSCLSHSRRRSCFSIVFVDSQRAPSEEQTKADTRCRVPEHIGAVQE